MVTRALFVAGRGSGPTDGLHYFSESDGTWSGRLLAPVDQLAALCWHPSLDIVYGLAGLGAGTMHAWGVGGVESGHSAALAERDSLGDIPCDLAVTPEGRMLVAANFGFNAGVGIGSLTTWALDENGIPEEEGTRVDLPMGSMVDAQIQASGHPHQIVFHGGLLYVPDYGADVIHRFGYRGGELVEISPIVAPAGSAPRHLVILPGERAVASAELASAVIAGGLEGEWVEIADSSRERGPAQGRHPKNFPGDIKPSPDRRYVYLANRGYETIATFAVYGATPELVAEIDSGTTWPQHLLVSGDELLVAGWDSSTVAALTLVDGIPGPARTLFECAGAGWLLEARAT